VQLSSQLYANVVVVDKVVVVDMIVEQGRGRGHGRGVDMVVVVVELKEFLLHKTPRSDTTTCSCVAS
jgi:predicted GNAT superfamily acetyltransferase